MDIGEITDGRAQEFAVALRQKMQDGEARWNDFIESIGQRVAKGKPLTDAQLNGVKRFMVRQAEFDARDAERAAQDAQAADVPEGPAVIEGVVISAKWGKPHPQYGQKIRITVRDGERGFRVNGNCPARVAGAMDDDPDRLKGVVVRFVANLTPSEDNPKFGFFKNPKDAVVVAVNGQQQEDVGQRLRNSTFETARQQNEARRAERAPVPEPRPVLTAAQATQKVVRAVSDDEYAVTQIVTVHNAIGKGQGVTLLVDGIRDDENLSDADQAALCEYARDLGRARDAQVTA